MKKSEEKFVLPNIQEEKTLLKSVRIKLATLYRIEELSKNSGLSINRIINECIEYALNNMADDFTNDKKVENSEKVVC